MTQLINQICTVLYKVCFGTCINVHASNTMLFVFFFQYSLVVLSLIVAQIIAVVLWILMNAEVSNFNCLMAFTYTWRQFLEILYMQEQKRIHGSKRGRGSRLSPPPGKFKYQSNLHNKIIIKIWSPTPFPHSRQIKLSPRTLSWKNWENCLDQKQITFDINEIFL